MADPEDEETGDPLPPLLRLSVPDAVIRDLYAMAALMRLGSDMNDKRAAEQAMRQAEACMEARQVTAHRETGIRRTTDSDHEHSVHLREEP